MNDQTVNEPMPTRNPSAGALPSMVAANGNPVAPGKAAATATDVKGGAKMYGFCSVETFCDQGPLGLTHDEVLDFYNYVKQFTSPNFWYQDAGVKPWIYYEQYDNWEDTYGADAVRVFYHSGHGAMGGDGTFYASMGADWGGLGCTVNSKNMRLGNEYLRYLFWSTCQSLKVFNGQTPDRSWNTANLGLRMIFGYETNSVDSANYGKFFWQEYNQNKSFSQAFLDASWRISHNQTPTVTACGATQAEAEARLFNERLFFGDAVSKNWWWWRWYSAAAAREAVTTVPQQLQHATLAPSHLSAQALFDRFGLRGALRDDGSASFEDGDRSLSRGVDGAYSVRLAAPNLASEQGLTMAAARDASDRIVDRMALADGASLVVDRVIHAQAAGGTGHGSGELAGSRTTETIIQYRQTIDGIPVISPGAGTLRVAVDNDGTVTRVDSALRVVRDLSAKGRRTPPQPEPDGQQTLTHDQEPSPDPQPPYELALQRSAAARLRTVIAQGGRGVVGSTTVPGSTEIGYDIKDDSAQLIATREIEVNFGGGFQKRFKIVTPLFG